MVADASMTRAFKAFVKGSSVAQAEVASDAPIVHAEAVLMALTMAAPMTCTEADSTASYELFPIVSQFCFPDCFPIFPYNARLFSKQS